MTDQPDCLAKIDPFFEVINDGDWNACVGEQGSELNYIDGYMDASLELVAQVIDRRLWEKRDTFILPILYNARHAVELALKFTINTLANMKVLNQPAGLRHDIQALWRRLADAKVGDHELRPILVGLEPFVASLARVDDDGQQLRYHQTVDGGTSLAGRTVVNLRLVRASLGELADLLQRLQHRMLDLGQEWPTGTRTADLSRTDLKAIAAMLPDHAAWRTSALWEAREAVTARFGIGRGKFSEAIDAIKASRELAAMVGIETPLAHLDDEGFLFLVGQWARMERREEAESEFGIVDVARMHETWKDDEQIERDVHDQVLGRLTAEQIADLETLYYLGRERAFGEYYERMLEGNLIKQRGGDQRWQTVHHILSKTNLREAVARGCRLAGRPSLAEQLLTVKAAGAD